MHALLAHRVAHALHDAGVPFVPRSIAYVSRALTGIEIHPAAEIGGGLFIDHGTGVVIGETAEIGDNVTLYQGVTLGGTGFATGKRHPTVEDNVTIGSGAKLLGPITVGHGAKVGANSVVITRCPAEHAPWSATPATSCKVDGASPRARTPTGSTCPTRSPTRSASCPRGSRELEERLAELGRRAGARAGAAAAARGGPRTRPAADVRVSRRRSGSGGDAGAAVLIAGSWPRVHRRRSRSRGGEPGAR